MVTLGSAQCPCISGFFVLDKTSTLSSSTCNTTLTLQNCSLQAQDVFYASFNPKQRAPPKQGLEIVPNCT